MSEVGGSEFIAKVNPDIQGHIENSVVAYQRQEKKENPDLRPDKKASDRVEAHLLRMETALEDDDPKKAQRKLEIFKAMVYPKVLIDKNRIPESYFELQKRIAKERGYGDVNITTEMKQEAGETLYNDQRKSLDVWFDYMLDQNATYPTWFKYYVLKSVTGLGNYDKEKKQFGKRTRDTTGIFPDLNREALAFVYDVVVQRHLKGLKQGEPDFQRIVDSANFGRIYGYAIDKVTPASKENKEKIEGEWVKFDQGSDPTPLYESLQGHGTGWCTAGQETARSQLQGGDFYVYYTKDQDDKKTIPRIAIRMENDQVAEVRGIESNQHMEGNMLDIAKEKYSQLPGGDKFEKRDHDMKFLTEIDKRVKNGQQLTKDDLRFLYEIDGKIEGFGYQTDPRIGEILQNRDKRKDLALVLNCRPNQISLTREEALKGDIKYYYGDLYLGDLTSAEGLTLPESVRGYLNLGGLTSAEGLTLPKSVRGSFSLDSLTSAEGLTLPESVGGTLSIDRLTSAEGLTLPESVGGDLYLGSLTSAEGLVLPELVGNLYLGSLTSAEKGVLMQRYPQLKIV